MKQILTSLVDKLLSKTITCSVGDIMLRGDDLDEGQLTIVTRYYDAEQYICEGDDSFRLQNAISRLLWGDNHDEKSGNQNFRNLIESYNKEGYNNNSYIHLDKSLSLMNGSHRVALNLFFGYWQIHAIIKGRNIYRKRSINWYANNGLQPKVISEIKEIRSLIIKRLFDVGSAFVIISSSLSPKDKDFLKEFLTKKTKTHRIYSIKKHTGIMVLYALSDPKYKVRNGAIHSYEAKTICKELSSKFNTSIVEYSLNCTDGMKLFEKFKKDIDQ